MAVDKGIVLVGALGETVTFPSAGRAYAYNETTGALISVMPNPEPETDAEFGTSVALSNGIAAIGAPGENVGSVVQAGKVYTFNVTTGQLLKTIPCPSGPDTSGDYFGHAVAVSGNDLIVGAYNWRENQTVRDIGQAYIYNLKTGKLLFTLNDPLPNVGEGGDSFGIAVSISGNLALVGAPNEYEGQNVLVGDAYLFNATTGAYLRDLPNPEVYPSDYGGSVAIDGSTAVVGAPIWNNYEGAAYVFNAQTGTLTATLLPPKDAHYQDYGFSVAITSNLIIVGSYEVHVTVHVGDKVKHYAGAGKVYTYNINTDALDKTLKSLNPQKGGNFGISVTGNGNTAIVGAWGEGNSTDPQCGFAYIFP